MSFIEDVKKKAKANLKTIVLPEAEDKRTLEAAQQIKKEGFAKLILLGNKETVEKDARNYGLDLSGSSLMNYTTMPMNVEIGGATIMVVPLERFEKY